MSFFPVAKYQKCQTKTATSCFLIIICTNFAECSINTHKLFKMFFSYIYIYIYGGIYKAKSRRCVGFGQGISTEALCLLYSVNILFYANGVVF